MELVACRAAALIAAGVAALLARCGGLGNAGSGTGERFVIAVDGSVYAKYAKCVLDLPSCWWSVCSARVVQDSVVFVVGHRVVYCNC